MNFANSLARWRKPAIIAVAILAVAAAGYFGYARFLRPQPASTSEDLQTVAVLRGDLIERVSISGGVDFPDSERLVFGTAGTVETVNVKQGERVSEGDELASLDPETIAGLEQALAQANIDLRDAEDALADFLETPPLALAQATQAVANARADIVNAEDAVDDILNPSEHRVSEARAAVSAARLRLRQEEDALDDLLDDPSDISVTRAETAVAAARLAVQRAEKALEDLTEPPTEAAIAGADERIAKARAALDAAEERRDDYESQKGIADVRKRIDRAGTSLARAERELATARSDTSESMKDSTEALDEAAKNYVDQFAKWLGVEVAIEQIDPDYAKALSDMGIDLDDAFSESRKETDLRGSDAPLGPTDDPATVIDERAVFAWLSQAPFAIDPTCEKDDDIPIYTICIENEFRTNGEAYVNELAAWNKANLNAVKSIETAQDAVDSAESELEDAREALADLAVDATKLAEYEAAVASARAEIDAAVEDREKLDDEPTAEEIADQNAKIALAKAEVDDALESLEKLRERTDTDEAAIADARERVKVAEAAIAEREKDLSDLTRRENDPAYPAAVESVNVANRALAEREKELAELLPDGRDRLRQELLARNVDAAQSTVSQAARRLDDATLTAPWDGFVSKVEIEKGDKVEASALAVELVNTNIVEIDGSVDEIDVLRIEVGSSAAVTLDALGGRELTGSVSFIDAAASDGNQGIVSVPVKVRLDMPDDLQIPKGLSAIATITVKEVRDVLLVPQRALSGRFDAPTLRVMVGEEITEVPVTIGESDNFMVVIESGVSEGDMIVAPLDGGGFGGPGGGPRGGGGPPGDDDGPPIGDP